MSQTLAQAFPVGDFLASELDERHWTQADFAEILGRPTQFVSEIISNKKEITRESAAQIGAALGTSAEHWLNLQNIYLLWKQQQDQATRAGLSEISLRARLNALAPISVLRKRGVLTGTTVAVWAQEICDLFQLDDIYDEPKFLAALRRANEDEPLSPTQKAWLACARRTANAVVAADYDPAALKALARELPRILNKAEAFASVPGRFATAGVRLVYVPAFPSSKINGATFLLDEHPGKPVIALSGRGRRLDFVLFTLLHEIAHLVRGDVKPGRDLILDEEDAETLGDEKKANDLAGKWLFPDELEAPPTTPRQDWVAAAAQARGVHPIVVVGRLQKLNLLDWRTALAKEAPTVVAQMESW